MIKASNDVRAALLRKGFKISENHHSYLIYYTLAGKKTAIFTKISHGSNHDIDDSLLGKMARQCKINKDSFCKMVECSIDQKKYESILPKAVIQ
jgi:hypothetical protein